MRPARYEIRCPSCHALQFMARGLWLPVAVDEALLVIQCWRRTCKRAQGWRLAENVKDGMA